VKMTFTPGFVRGLGKLPVEETGAEAGGDGLRVFCPVVMAEAIVAQAEGFGEHPSLAVVLVEEQLDSFLAVAAAGADLLLKVMEGNEGQDCMAQFGILVFVDTPEALGVEFISCSISRL